MSLDPMQRAAEVVWEQRATIEPKVHPLTKIAKKVWKAVEELLNIGNRLKTAFSSPSKFKMHEWTTQSKKSLFSRIKEYFSPTSQDKEEFIPNPLMKQEMEFNKNH